MRSFMRGSLLIGLAFAGGWLFLPEKAPVIALVQGKHAEWLLEELPRRLDQTPSAARAAAGAYWGAAAAIAPAPAGPADDLSWRVSAIFGIGSGRKLLVSFRNPTVPARTLKVGDKLPSGHEVTQIGERDYCVRIGNSTFRLGVERSEQ